MTLLKGMKVLDFTTLLPGPYATLMLADMGADVLRIESPTRKDLVKEMAPIIEGNSATHHYLNRGKKSLALDLKHPSSKEIILSLLQEYDVVIEQFRPGVMERLGLDYESLKEHQPKLIYCSLTSFGQTGPYRNHPGHDNNFLALSGVLGYSHRQQERPVPQGIQIGDLAGGALQSVIGILAAYIQRERTGKGEYVDVSMTDTTFALNAMFGPGALMTGKDLEPETLLLNGGSYYDYYETADGRFISVGSLEPPFLKTLCEIFDDPSLTELAFQEDSLSQVTFKQQLLMKFKQKTFKEWQTIFQKAPPCCVEPVLTFLEASKHPQIQAREMIVELESQSGHTLPQFAFPLKFKNTEIQYTHSGVPLGHHRSEVLKRIGVTEEQMMQLEKEGLFRS